MIPTLISVLTIVSLLMAVYKRYVEPQRHQSQHSKKVVETPHPETDIEAQINAYESVQDVTSLVRLLAHQDYEIREQATLALGRLGEQAIPALGQVLVDGTLEARQMATQALATIHHEQVLRHLLLAIKDVSFWVRLPAIDGLASFLDEQEVVTQLQHLRVHDTHPDVRQKANDLLNQVHADH